MMLVVFQGKNPRRWMKEFDPRTLQQQIISAPTRQQSSHFLAGALGTWCSSRVWNPGSTSHEKPPHSYWFMSYFWPILSKLFLKIQIWKFQLMNHECIFMVFSSMFNAFFHYSAVINSVFVLNCCLFRFYWHNLVTYAECLPFSAWLPLYHIRFIRCHTPMKGSNLNEP